MQKRRNINVFSHIFVWLGLFSMPYVLSYGQSQEMDRIIAHFWIPIAFYVVIFYSNYVTLIDRFLFPKKMVLFIIINVAMIAVFITLKEQIEHTFFGDLTRGPFQNKHIGPPLKMFFYVQMLSYMAPLLFAIAIKSTKKWVKTEAERKEAANFKLQSELQHLHYQLQPHFFFNSLNNIYAMVDVSPTQAKTSIHSLSKLMRYMLYETNVELVPLSSEIDFMKKFIDLMTIRVSEKTEVNYTFPKEGAGIKIAPLLYISLIENAFKHGVSANKTSAINITMKRVYDVIVFTIENDNFPKKKDDKSGSGIGLQNLEKRLELLYPDKHDFTTSIKGGRFSVHLAIETT